MHKNTIRLIEDSLPPGATQERADFLAFRVHSAGAWMTASTRAPANRMTDVEFRNGFCFRFGLPLPYLALQNAERLDEAGNLKICASCGEKSIPLTGHHAFSCSGSRPAAATRHRLVNNACIGYLRSLGWAGLHVRKEPKMADFVLRNAGPPPPPSPLPLDDPGPQGGGLEEEAEAEDGPVPGAPVPPPATPSASRADFALSTANGLGTRLVDLVITFPNVKTYPKAALTRLTAAHHRKRAKVTKYQRDWEISEEGVNRLVIFAMEAHGGLHKSSQGLLQWVARTVHPPQPESDDRDGLRSLLMAYMRQRLSVACMKGNSAIFDRWINVGVFGV